MLSVAKKPIMLGGIMLYVVMLNVLAPYVAFGLSKIAFITLGIFRIFGGKACSLSF
jgi:hypothetical protein